MRPALQFPAKDTSDYDVCTVSTARADILPVSEKNKRGGKRIRTVEFINGMSPSVYLL